MNNMQKQLWVETLKNLLISTALFACLMCLLWIVELLSTNLTLLKWTDTAWCIGIPASVIGVAYVLSIRNPLNYTGFYAGIVMSALLAVQFLLQKQYDSTFLYICVFIPFQARSIANWKKTVSAQPDSTTAPEFLSMRDMLLSVLVFLLIIVADYLIATFVFQHNTLLDNVSIKLFNAMLIASSVLANFWLIYRKNDSWVYWLVYSISGIVLFVIIDNIFSIVLFSFFLVINSLAGIAWFRSTPSENMGWLKRSANKND